MQPLAGDKVAAARTSLAQCVSPGYRAIGCAGHPRRLSVLGANHSLRANCISYTLHYYSSVRETTLCRIIISAKTTDRSGNPGIALEVSCLSQDVSVKSYFCGSVTSQHLEYRESSLPS